MAERWLTIVGIGEDGLDGLPPATRALIADAEIVFGGARHLALVEPLGLKETRRWQSPFETSIEEIVRLRTRKRVCVLASGDPFSHGVGATLARRISAREMHVTPAPSAFSLAAARMGWALQEVTTLSLHGHPIALVLPHLHPGRRILALTSDAAAPGEIARLLTANGFGPSTLTVLESLGGPDEAVREVRADRYDLENVSPLNVLAIETHAESHARILPLTPGLNDDLFETDGQMTKREVRALTLSALAPLRGQLLWDIGAGSGSVAIEWMLADPSLTAIAIEPDAARRARIAANATAFGVPGLDVKAGTAPDALAGLPSPDAVFIGGGGTDDGVLDAAIKALPVGGRLVANAVTLEMETLLSVVHRELGGTLTRIAVSRAEPLGSMTGWRPAMPVTQWVWIKRRETMA
ncbi:precorrin-6y C5,15-methyltransferase (decarboxylating) subunit CbiE [Pelagibacterium xiamenense]|uniref:precorrin-6y C5,15-methyltransferase (decarboxylating) subunit CbiE n=1 Tax=Pelagibacterium xiamenense TaxID=2901140 RepID=UPI001E3EC809|nr:precorrin-6y C5,15-methyltransferase (decarboxylating) subunit CbiE [Pelagibacterium xiamenense]MCD7059634.1 precorrin-6y C5,15-methyltransferase (decarboxylating) subunit CbiE [Pelagibacterium xiamenense]